MKTYCEFTSEAAPSVAPYSGLLGHTLVAKLTLGDAADPVFGRPLNFYEVEELIAEPKGRHGAGSDQSSRDTVAEVGVASPETIGRHPGTLCRVPFPGLERVGPKRRLAGTMVGCMGRGKISVPVGLAA